MSRLAFVALVGLLTPTASTAQARPVDLVLTVRSSEGLPIAQGTVRLIGTDRVATTDTEGRARLSAPAAGPYLLQLDAPGRTTLWRGVTLAEADADAIREIRWDAAETRGTRDRTDLASRLGAGTARLVASSEDLGGFRSFDEATAALAAAADAPACVRQAVDGRLVAASGREYVYTGPGGIASSGLPQFGPRTVFLNLPTSSGLTGATAPGPNYDILGPGLGGRALPGEVPSGVRQPAIYLSAIAVVEYLPAEAAARAFRRLPEGCAVLQAWSTR